jgi:hypothetical protein
MRTTLLRMAAKKHQTEVRASRWTTTATTNDTTSIDPIVRTRGAADTKNGMSVGTKYASSRRTWRVTFSLPE